MKMRTKILSHIISILFSASMVLAFPSRIDACRTFRPSPQAVVSGAEIIVRATAVRYVRAPEGNIRALHEPGDAEIEFRVEEILKGANVPSTIILNGYLTDRDDFNDHPVPYDFVRPGGRGGSCSAYEYKQSAEFLLFLKERDGKLTVGWYALAPTNEQLRSVNDPWLAWVREQSQSSERRKASPESVCVFSIFAPSVYRMLRFPLGGTI